MGSEAPRPVLYLGARGHGVGFFGIIGPPPPTPLLFGFWGRGVCGLAWDVRAPCRDKPPTHPFSPKTKSKKRWRTWQQLATLLSK